MKNEEEKHIIYDRVLKAELLRRKETDEDLYLKKLPRANAMLMAAQQEINKLLGKDYSLIVYGQTETKKMIVPFVGAEAIVLKIICEVYDANGQQVLSHNRKRINSDARTAFVMVLSEFLDIDYTSVMAILNKDRTCFYSHQVKHRELMDSNPVYCSKYDKVLERLSIGYHSE